MHPRHHHEKNERLLRAFNNFDLDDDSEAIFELAMILGTHWLNVALHERGLTQHDEDLLHTDKPEPWFSIPPDLEPAFVALKAIEDERNRFVRGPEPCPASSARWCKDKLNDVRALALPDLV